MDAERWLRVERVLDAALESDPEGWPAVLDATCGGDEELRADVQRFLSEFGAATRFLETPPIGVASALVSEMVSRGPSSDEYRIGPYRVLRQVGEGGMARVYLAERVDGQFSQRVALKLLRPGLDTEFDQRRFRAERQILASLSHPHIARLLDGGVTGEGRPFLALEYVEGQPIDRYAADRRLPLEERLRLFLTVVEAVQYAHRNLVVHRDLKPSNILVAVSGDVKLLDFGLAKLLQPDTVPNADRTTAAAHRWMTPEYAAPEQIRGDPVTTLTDVYQLGVVLHELLTGSLPFGVRGDSPHSLQDAILHHEPALPSSVSPAAGLKGDLDAIILKALRKEPELRYASPDALADEVRRHLSGHPVVARGQDRGYRVRRYIRRHRVGLTASATIAVLVVAYAVTATVQRSRIEAALAQATVGALRAEQVTDLMLGLFEASESGKAFADTVTARALLGRGLERARDRGARPEVRAQMLDVIGRLHMQLGAYERARGVFAEAVATRRTLGSDTDLAVSLSGLADALHRSGTAAGSIPARREALAINRKALGPDHSQSLDALLWLANGLHESGASPHAWPLYDEWMSRIAKQPAEISDARGTQLLNLGLLLGIRRDTARAERLLREAVATYRAVHGDQHPRSALALTRLGSALRMSGKLAEAERTLEDAVAVLGNAYPSGHPYLAQALKALGVTLERQERWDAAEARYYEAERITRQLHGDASADVASVLEDRGRLLHATGAFDRAEPVLREAFAIRRRQSGGDGILTWRAGILLGDVLRERGKLAEAESLLVAGHATLRHSKVPSMTERSLRLAVTALVRLYERQGRQREAAAYRALQAP